MYFSQDGVLMVQRSAKEFWSKANVTPHKGAWWFPLNWVTMPLAAYKRRLAYMQATYFDE